MLTIRAARATDAPAMAEVRREAILSKGPLHYQRSIVDTWVAEAAPERVARYAQQIADPEYIVHVAETGSDLIGFAICHPANAELSAIYVKPNTIGRVGRALLSQLETCAFQVTDALTIVASLNAVQFYTENGYVDGGPMYYVDSTGSRVPCRSMRKVWQQ
jgi:hypothetical protein